MAKSKYAPALFEVINRQRNTGNKLGVPKWWKGLGRTGTSEATDEAQQPAGAASASPDIVDTTPESDANVSNTPTSLAGTLTPAASESEDAGVSTHAAPPNSEQASAEGSVCQRLFQVEGGRVWISLNTSQAAIIGSLLVVALVISFGLGRMGRPSSLPAQQNENDVDRILAETPNSSVLNATPLNATPDKAVPAASKRVRTANPAVGSGKPADAASAGQDELKVGLRYVVLDTYNRADRASAEHVQKWLASTHNIPTVLRQTKTGNSYLLISKAGFDWSNPAEQEKCNQLAERIKSLGKDCRKELIKADLRVYTLASPQIREITPK